jgi:hypothetical protein
VRISTLLTAALAATSISSSAAQATIRLANDPGGLIAAYQQRFAHARATGERIVIDGSCLSACTLAIGMVPREQICATPRAVLGFHAAWQPTPFGGKAVSFPATQHMMSIYPTEVQNWINRHGGLTPRMMFLRGQELAEYVPTCAEGDTAVVHSVTHRTHRPSRPSRQIVAFGPGHSRPIFAVRPMQ